MGFLSVLGTGIGSIWGPIGGAVGGGIGSLLEGGLESNQAGKAADAQLQGNREAIAENRRQYDLNRLDYQPYRETGVRALGSLESDINKMPTAEEVMAQPGYQFGLKQGQLGLDRKFAAAGGRVSGAALKAASSYATDYATTGYSAEYQRRQDRLNRLAALAGIGQTATAGTTAAGARSTNAISGLMQDSGDVMGASTLARGNIWRNTLNEMASQWRDYKPPPRDPWDTGQRDTSGQGE